MRTVLITIMALSLAGCFVEVLTTTAITGELQAQQLSAMKGQIEHAAGTAGKVNLQRAVDTYHAEKGHYPKTLAEVAPVYIQSVPLQTNGASYAYNPATGRISETDGTAPAGPVPEDLRKMRALSAAIQQHARRTRQFPSNLEMLAPNYFAEVPRTSTGQAFLYNPQTGRIGHPQATTTPQAPVARPRQGYAGGPMGEVMTGIAMQRELNNFSNAGTNAAGNRAGDASRGFGNARSQHQLDTMDDLGL